MIPWIFNPSTENLLSASLGQLRDSHAPIASPTDVLAPNVDHLGRQKASCYLDDYMGSFQCRHNERDGV